MERKGYLRGVELLKRVLLGCWLCCWRFFIGTKYCCFFISPLDTLRGSKYGLSVDSTLGDGTTSVLYMGVSVAIDGSIVFCIMDVTGCVFFSQLS